jgi:hypothetical protein
MVEVVGSRDCGRCSVSHGFVAQVRGLQPLTGNSTGETRKFVSKHGSVASMNITAIGRKTFPSVSITASPQSETRPVVSLSEFTKNYREQFVAALQKMEEISAGLPPISVIRGDPAADIVLARRLTALAEKWTQLAGVLTRK